MTIKDIFEMLDLFYAIKHMHERLLRAEKRRVNPMENVKAPRMPTVVRQYGVLNWKDEVQI